MSENSRIEQMLAHLLNNSEPFPLEADSRIEMQIKSINELGTVRERQTAADLASLSTVVDQIVKSIANEYDATATYAVGALVRYNGKLYRCNTAIVTPEPWTAAHWTEVDLEDEITAIKAALADRYTKTETNSLLAEKAQKMSVETTLPATAVVNTIYKLNTGGATSASVVTTLPAGTTVGDVISIIWYNGATPATVTITGTMIPFSYTPTANTRSEINAMWDGTNWCLVSNEQAVTASE